MRSVGDEKLQRLAFADFERGRIVCTEPFFGFVEENRDYDLTALAKLRDTL